MDVIVPGERDLLRISAALAARDKTAIAEAMQDALGSADPAHVEEVILQSYLFLGFPACLNGFALWRRICGQRPVRSESLDPDIWTERGLEVCGAVYAGQFDRLRDNIRELHPDMERWMVTEGYGKVLGRPGLGLDVREVCIVALLAVLGVPKQLYSHLRGALNVGASAERVEAALGVADEHLDQEGRRQAARTWQRVRERTADPTTGQGGGGVR